MQRQRITVGLDLQSDGLESGLVLPDVKVPGLRIAGCVEKAECGTNTRNSEIMKLISDGLDFLGKRNWHWRMDLLYLTRQELTRNYVFLLTEKLPEQWMLQRDLRQRLMTLGNEMQISFKETKWGYLILDGSEIMVVVICGRSPL